MLQSKATTLEQLKFDIANWLLQEATAYRSKGRVSERVHYKAEQFAIADAMDAAGKYVLAMKVENGKEIASTCR
jgi:hypothetical protein